MELETNAKTPMIGGTTTGGQSSRPGVQTTVRLTQADQSPPQKVRTYILWQPNVLSQRTKSFPDPFSQKHLIDFPSLTSLLCYCCQKEEENSDETLCCLFPCIGLCLYFLSIVKQLCLRSMVLRFLSADVYGYVFCFFVFIAVFFLVRRKPSSCPDNRRSSYRDRGRFPGETDNLHSWHRHVDFLPWWYFNEDAEDADTATHHLFIDRGTRSVGCKGNIFHIWRVFLYVKMIWSDALESIPEVSLT